MSDVIGLVLTFKKGILPPLCSLLSFLLSFLPSVLPLFLPLLLAAGGEVHYYGMVSSGR